MSQNDFLLNVLNQAKLEKAIIDDYGIDNQKCAIMVKSKMSVYSIDIQSLCEMKLSHDFEIEFMFQVFEEAYGENVIWYKSIDVVINYIQGFLLQKKVINVA